jgi:hypothetical protein
MDINCYMTFDPNNPGCRPALFNPITKEKLPSNHPHMKAMSEVWDDTDLEDQIAFWEVTMNNNTEPAKLAKVKLLGDRVIVAIRMYEQDSSSLN